jgi:Uma2 family endonuclease
METLTILSDYEIERKKPMPSRNHTRVEHRLNFLLAQLSDYDILPKVSLDLPAGDTVPDLCLYPKMDFDWKNDLTHMLESPVTIFEILCLSQNPQELIQKIRTYYFPSGVKSRWLIVLPLKTVYVYYPDQTPQVLTTGLIKDEAMGVEVKVEDIFC